jgi:CRP-like cAMP-binding protein
MEREEELQALLLLVKVKGCVSRGEDIVEVGKSPSYSTVLLKGLACRYKLIENGRRQIFNFQYPGDFCDFDRYILPEPDDAVAALTDCSIGVILHEDIGRVTARYPRLGLALWRGTMVEASISRERLLNVRQRPALPRTANLLCEQMVRLEAIGINGAIIPMTQVDLADAASLSAVHMNRTIQDLRGLGVLSRNGRAIEVVHRDRLADIGKFDGRYLNTPQEPSPRKHAVTTAV